MKLSLDKSIANTILAYDTGLVRVQSRNTAAEQPGAASLTIMDIRTSVIITPEQIIDSWQAQSHSTLSPEHMQVVLELEPEIVILGTGRRLQFPATEILAQCHKAGVGVEVMDTGAACRTYNILAGEGRRVAAALIMIG